MRDRPRLRAVPPLLRHIVDDRLLVERLGCAPGDCLFFDDRQANVDAARAAGLRAELWPGADAAVSLLR